MGEVDLKVVAETIREIARAEALPRWQNLAAGDVEEKAGPDDLVTVADKAVEVALGDRLRGMLSGSAVVGEEGVHADPSLLGLLRHPAPAWVIDPIDGTSNFAAGNPDFAVMVALVVGHQLIGGWIYIPVADETTAAMKGQGVWRRRAGAWERLVKPPTAKDLSGMHGITGRRLMSPERQARIARAQTVFASIDPAGCAGIQYPQLADGTKHFALYNKSEPWDHLPGLALVAEHGYHYARHDGSPYTPGDNTGGLLVAPDQASWDAIHEVLLA